MKRVEALNLKVVLHHPFLVLDSFAFHRRLPAFIGGSMFLLCALSAQAYPDKPVRLIVPYPPGGSVDFTGRELAAKLSEYWGQQVVLDNRGGAGGVIAGEIVAKATPDGYTLLVAAVAVMTRMPRTHMLLSRSRSRYSSSSCHRAVT